MYEIELLNYVFIFKYILSYFFDSWHTSCALSGNRVLIHGGYDGNNALSDSAILNLGIVFIKITVLCCLEHLK